MWKQTNKEKKFAIGPAQTSGPKEFPTSIEC